MDYEFVRVDQLDLFVWGELEGEGGVYYLLDLQFFLGLPAARSASPLSQLTDRFGLIAIDNLHFLNRLIANRVAAPLNLPQTGLWTCTLILNLINVLLLQVDYHVGVIECEIQDVDDLVAQVSEGGEDFLLDGFSLFQFKVVQEGDVFVGLAVFDYVLHEVRVP